MITDESSSHVEDETLVVRPVEIDDPMLVPPTQASMAAPTPEAAAAPDAESRKTWLTAEWSDRFGPAGHFVDLTQAEEADAEDGVLVEPTAEQLSMRLR